MVKIFACSGDINTYTTGDMKTLKNPYKIPDEQEAQAFMQGLADRAKEELSDPSVTGDPVKYGGVFSKWLYSYALNLPPLDGLPSGRGVLAHHLMSGDMKYEENHIIIPTWEAACLAGVFGVMTPEESAYLKRLGRRINVRRRITEDGLLTCMYVKTLLLLAGRPYKVVKGDYRDGLFRKAMTNQEAVKIMLARGLMYA